MPVKALKIIATVFAVTAVSGCAARQPQIIDIPMNPALYQHSTCPMLMAEAQRLSNRTRLELGYLPDPRREKHNQRIFRWGEIEPGTPYNPVEFARLKGEMEAVHIASVNRRCPVFFDENWNAHNRENVTSHQFLHKEIHDNRTSFPDSEYHRRNRILGHQ